MFFADPGTQFLSDQIQGYVVAATSELPCPSCLTGLMEVIDEPWVYHFVGDNYDGFRCRSCERRVLIERMP